MSGWQDLDKEGQRYKEYFPGASEYWISNFRSEARGFQGDLENEFFLDLVQDLDDPLAGKFDVVFNHTVLEHIFEVNKAFANLCRLSRDVVIVVVPFLQEEHADYGDYWRFTPQAVDKLFQANGFETVYVNYNDDRNASIYLLAVGSRNPERWQRIAGLDGNKKETIYDPRVGAGMNVIQNPYALKVQKKLAYEAKRLMSWLR
ncbi:hypothetical protein [Hyphomicrobium sp. CS1GBMeth3]|uniref:hypothetical protein n=1 Tax=Hyphomicrobium sp. CS1GBMeth3 TaxID=1892845 RepID=UPI001114FDC8|nr:hypothetical protein [Hyphomicrobium sp. CS1GBMeth3]